MSVCRLSKIKNHAEKSGHHTRKERALSLKPLLSRIHHFPLKNAGPAKRPETLCPVEIVITVVDSPFHSRLKVNGSTRM